MPGTAARSRPRAGRSSTPRRLLDRLSRVASATVFVSLVVLTSQQVLQGITPELALWRDFGQDYLLARAFLDGVDPYVPVRTLATRYLEPVGFMTRATPAPHPPSVALLVLPLALLDYTDAVRAWFVLQVAALLLAVYLMLRGLDIPYAVRLTPPLTLLQIAWPAVALDLGLGQSTTILLALLAAAQLALLRNRPRLAGFAVGVSMLLKPLAWPWLLFFGVRRRWSALLLALLVAVVGWVLPAVRFGVGPIAAYFTSVLPSMSSEYATEITNLSWWTIGPRVFQGTSSVAAAIPPLIDAPALGRGLGAAVPIVLVVGVVVWLVSRQPTTKSALAVLAAVMLLASPISWTYYLAFASLPVACAAVMLWQRRLPVAPTLLGLIGVALMLPDEPLLIAYAAQLSASPGESAVGLDTLPALLTLAPGVGLAVVAGLVVWLESQRIPSCSAQG